MEISLKIYIPIPGIILVREHTQFEIAFAFMRLQEFYECADVSRQGKFYKHAEIIEHYASTTGAGKFSYLEDWGGFNVDGHTVNEFVKMYKHDFSVRELALFDTISKVLIQEENAVIDDQFYLIGTCSQDYVQHEICHALWFLYPEFKEDAEALIKKLPKSYIQAVYKMLSLTGYATNVFEDELNAYIATSDMRYLKEHIFTHFVPTNNVGWSWDRLYPIVENYWDWKEYLELNNDEWEIKLS